MKYRVWSLFAVLFMLFFASCEEEEFQYDLDLLTGTEWGIPRILETGPSGGVFIQTSPNVFYKDGRVSFGGKTDFWQVRDSRSLLIQQREQIWQVLELSDNKLHVEVLKFPDGEFLVNAVFYPIEE